MIIILFITILYKRTFTVGSLLNFFSKITKGDEGENAVLNSITKILRNSNDEENFFLLQKVKIPDTTRSIEIDLLLLHPTLGIFVIEVKNWESISSINKENNPFEQSNTYKNILMAFLQEKLGKLPINVESRVVFPLIESKEACDFFEKNIYYSNYKNVTFFKNDLQDKNLLQKFFASSSSILPNKKEFMNIASLLMDKDLLKNSKDKIIPVITKDEVLFFDYKQLSILNGYTGGFRIIRGVAGTGKTIILTNFVQNKIENDNKYKFLILCFNKNLATMMTESFDEKYKKNIAAYSLYQLLTRIEFDFKKVGIISHGKDKTSLDEQFEIFKSSEATKEFALKFKQHLVTHPIDYFMCDETQDMPPNFMRIIYEEIKDCIFFIDEAQKFYRYSMNSIAEVFHHPDFEKLSMAGRVKNLKNVYRTPSNIARCAFEILTLDTQLNNYYKKSYYLKNDFLNDINFVLEDGSLNVGNWDDFDNLKKLINTFTDETVILTQFKTTKFKGTVTVESLEEYIKSIGKQDLIKVMTLQSVKGLEAKNIVLHNFDAFLKTTAKNDPDILYRKVYVLLTRALENLYISIENQDKLVDNAELKNILEIINKHQIMIQDKASKNEVTSNKSSVNLAKLKPKLSDVKETGEVIVVAAELFALVAGFFG